MLRLMRWLLIAFGLVAALGNGVGAQPFYITNVTIDAGALALDWMSPKDLYIVAQSVSLGGGSFGYVGSVLSTNHADLASDLPTAFFRVRRVAVVDIPDPNLRLAVTNAMAFRHAPLGPIYDIDVETITNLNAAGIGITNATGLTALTGLKRLDISQNQLTNLDVSGLANLQYLNCSWNQLTDLRTRDCTALQTLHCGQNWLKTLDLTGLTNLNLLGCSDNNLTDLSAAVSNAAMGGMVGGDVYAVGNALSDDALTNQVPYLTNRQVAVHLQPNWADYAWWAHQNGPSYFATNWWIPSGMVHADDTLYFQGSIAFESLVTSLVSTNGGSTNAVIFKRGFKLSTGAGSMTNVPFDDLKALGGSISIGIVCATNTTIRFDGTNCWAKYSSGSSWTNLNQPFSRQLISVCGDAYVAGVLDGRLTIVADGAIHITNTVTYASDPRTNAASDDALGLIGKSDVWIETSCPTNMLLFAHVMATGVSGGTGTFGVVNYITRAPGTLTVYGGVVQSVRGAVGLIDGHAGYTKVYTYDKRLTVSPPPFYPEQ